MSNYFGNEKLPRAETPTPKRDTYNQIVVTATAIVSLISIVVLIALNITNLAATLRSTPGEDKFNLKLDNVLQISKDINTVLIGAINPKVGLINTATSYKLPGLITTQARAIRDEINKVCIPRYQVNQTQCPVTQTTSNSAKFKLYDPNFVTQCSGGVPQLATMNQFQITPFASFIPTGTSLTGCVRIPTFDLGEHIYSYSHNLMDGNCRDSTQSNQYWSIGVITDGLNNTPAFKEVVNWFLNDGYNRKSCSTAVSGFGAWLACSIVTQTEKADYESPGIEDIMLLYMDIYGTRKQWLYTQNEIDMPDARNSLYFSVGSGVVIEGTVYFLAYGGMTGNIPGNAYCPVSECVRLSRDQTICNRAQRPRMFGAKQILSSIVSFEDQITEKPRISVKTVPPTEVIMGAEGRLYRTPYSEKSYIYLRSSSWYGGLMFGEIDLQGSLNITWRKFTTVARPGAGACMSSNRCPAECITGVYTDFFLLSTEQFLGVTIELTGGKLRRGPAIKLADQTNVIASQLLVNPTKEAAYTTTTCFIYSSRPWCISIIEMIPGAIGSYQPVAILYPVWSTCNQDLFKLDYDSWPKNGTYLVDPTTPYPYAEGPSTTMHTTQSTTRLS
ncbi:glycoprotein [Hipposideros bat paramyxovirus]|nr:glycoprotein [Hipposideros bat paramyxovirus]